MLSEYLFGEGNCFNESEVRKRMYGMKRLIEIIDNENHPANVADRILSISDLHCPYQLSTTIFEKYKNKVDTLQINGDVLDCYSISKFPKTHHISPIDEMICARDYLIELLQMLKPKRVFINYGNHDVRLASYLAQKLDTEIQELIPETPLDYLFIDGFNYYNRETHVKSYYDALKNVFPEIEFVYEGQWYSVIGDTIFCHPKTFSSAPLKTAEKALYWFRNEGMDFKNLVMAHTHRIGFYKIGDSNIYEQGACCDIKRMDYNEATLVNSQKEGYIYMCQDKEGNTLPELTKLESLN